MRIYCLLFLTLFTPYFYIVLKTILDCYPQPNLAPVPPAEAMLEQVRQAHQMADRVVQDEASRRQQLAEEAREVNTMWTSAAQLSAAVDLLQNTTASILQSEKHAMLLATATA